MGWIYDFNKLKERVTTRFESWNGQLLSKARKMILIKYVVQAIPTYTMSTLRISEGVRNNLDTVVRRFGGNHIRGTTAFWL